MIELRQLRQFVAVAEEMSFRRAAERLNMAQPPLTIVVKQIEKELGVVLLERDSRIVALTEPGRTFLEEARRTIAQADRAVTMTRRAGEGLGGCLRVKFVPSLAHDLLPRILRTFREQHAGVELELEEAPTAQQVIALTHDRADIGLLVTPVVESWRLVVETVFQDRLIAAIPCDHRLAAKRRITLHDLKSEPWILSPASQAPGFYSRIVSACAKAGFVPQVTQHAVQLETILGLVAGESGVSLVPGRLVRPRADVIFRDVAGRGAPITYEISAAWHESATSHPGLTAFLGTIRHIMRTGTRSMRMLRHGRRSP